MDVEFCLLPYKIYGSWILPYTLELNIQDILFLCLIFSYHNIEESQEHTPNSWTINEVLNIKIIFKNIKNILTFQKKFVLQKS